MNLDDVLLEDAAALADADTCDLLLITASAGASVRASMQLVDSNAVDRIVDEGRPRAIVVAGGGGSRVAGDILSAVAGTRSPVPVVTVGGPGLPGWVGPVDLVVVVSGSGVTRETLAVAGEAARRGCRLTGICPDGSRLGQFLDALPSAQRFDVGIPPTLGRWRARSLIWSLATPILLVGGALGLVEDAPGAVLRTADLLDDIADRCAPMRDSITNPAKQWAVELSLSLPLVWGTGDVGGVAVRRLSSQLAQNAGLPAMVGTLPAAGRTQAALLAGPRAGQVGLDDIFRDRVADPDCDTRIRLVMLRDADEHPEVEALAGAACELASKRGVPVSVLKAEAGHPLERLATLIGMPDFASVYAALVLGIDPMAGTNELDGRVGL